MTSPIPNSTWSVDRFLTGLASSKPVPGGGSAAALAGALGASLGSMVSRILLSRPRIRGRQRAHVRRGLKRLDQASRRLKRLIREDASGYERFVRARDSRAWLRARAGAVRSPVRICEATAQALEVMAGLEDLAGVHLGSDVKAGRALLLGAFEAAFVTAQVNLKGSDPWRRRS